MPVFGAAQYLVGDPQDACCWPRGFFQGKLARARFGRRAPEVLHDVGTVDILPAMNGRDSYGVPAGFAGTSGFLPNRLTSAEDCEEA